MMFWTGSRDIGMLLSSLTSFVASTRLNRSRVGAIDSPDQPRQVFDQYDTCEVPENFSWATFRWIVVKKSWFFGSCKACISKIAYTSLATTTNYHLFTTIDQKVAQENFSGTSHVSYWSKTWRGWSGLSIAQTLDQFRLVEATNNANEERNNPVSRSVPLKKNAHLLTHQKISKEKMTRSHNFKKFDFPKGIPLQKSNFLKS